MKFTIGMACYDDFNGVYFSINHLRMMEKELSDVEFLVVDNNPGSRSGDMTKQFVERVPNARYIPFNSVVGTTVPRDRVFHEATGDVVICMDSHVLLAREALDRLRLFFYENPEFPHLFTGPLVLDNFTHKDIKSSEICTHFDDTWRDQMWGIWGTAWECKCRQQGCLQFTVVPVIDNPNSRIPVCHYRALSMGHVPVTHCAACGSTLPEDLEFLGHQAQLRNLKYYGLGIDDNDPPFRIPGQGLGLFGCRKDSWVGFNPNFRGFGGEEMYIHEKFRMFGKECYNFPFLKWQHRFGREHHIPYPLTVWNKVRNYVLGLQELGKSLDPVYSHFVTENNYFPQEHWDYLVEDPLARVSPPKAKASCAQAQKSEALPSDSLDELFDYLCKRPRDLNEHLPVLRAYATRTSKVLDITRRRESSVAFAAAGCEVFSCSQEADDEAYKILKSLGASVQVTSYTPEQVLDMFNKMSEEPDAAQAQYDILFLDTKHTSAWVYKELETYQAFINRFIILHDTALYAERGEDGGPGLLDALRKFMKKFPKWSVVYHTQQQYGLTILGCQSEDKPKPPSKITMAANFAKALAEHVVDGGHKASLAVVEQRLETCTLCPQRSEEVCTVCGCNLQVKAKWSSSVCPLGMWRE